MHSNTTGRLSLSAVEQDIIERLCQSCLLDPHVDAGASISWPIVVLDEW